MSSKQDQLVINSDGIEPVKCSNCEKILLNIQRHEHNLELICYLVVDCPFCGDKSFQKEIYGPLRYHPADKVRIKSVQNEGKKVHFSTCK